MTLTSCTAMMESLPGVYKLDIQQGNIINQEMIDQLRPDMTKRQVLYVMGSPMLVDVFHQQRWDYIYSEQEDDDPRMQKRITLYFEGDNLIGVQGDFRPSSKPPERISHETTLELPKRNLEKTLWEKITGLFGFETVDDDGLAIDRTRDSDASDDPLSSSSNPN
ncbi:MAG: outer membrane protein assembly factor BamE [Gammaproteobacteria bacterium]